MGNLTIVYDKAALVSFAEPDKHFQVGSTYTYDQSMQYALLMQTSQSLDAFKFNKLKSVTVGMTFTKWDPVLSTYTETPIEYVDNPEDFNTITMNDVNLPPSSLTYIKLKDVTLPSTVSAKALDFYRARRALTRTLYYSDSNATCYTPNSEHPPFISIEYGDLDGLDSVKLTYPIEGATITPSLDNTFSWECVPEFSTTSYSNTIEPITLSRVLVRWREKGASTYHEVDAGASSTYTFPVNTFLCDEIEWQISAIANSGVATTTAWQSVKVFEPASTAQIVAPKSTSIDGTKDNRFEWNHIISSGTTQTGYDLQVSPDNVVWDTIFSEKTSNTFVVVPANKLSAGRLYWRVRTYNAINTAGEWSTPAYIFVVAAPNTPAVAISDSSPKFAIRWQQESQQACEIMFDGEVVAKKFGPESSYFHQSYAPLGDHTVKVRIQNNAGLWSDWGLTPIHIENEEGSPLQLRVDQNNGVTLTWNHASEYSGYIVYRNGKRIAQTADNTFVDHFALGEATYQIRGVYEDSGYYTLSNEATLNASVACMMIAAVNEPVWQKLNLSSGSLRSTGLSASRSVTYLHHVGAALPSAEIGEAVTMTYNLDCAFKASDLDAARAFEALLGKLVCVKEPGGERYIGVLDSYSKENIGRLYRSYKARIALVDWEEGAT